jgi:hypothetical protein
VKAVDSVADTVTVALVSGDCRSEDALAAIVDAADAVVAKVTRETT